MRRRSAISLGDIYFHPHCRVAWELMTQQSLPLLSCRVRVTCNKSRATQSPTHPHQTSSPGARVSRTRVCLQLARISGFAMSALARSENSHHRSMSPYWKRPRYGHGPSDAIFDPRATRLVDLRTAAASRSIEGHPRCTGTCVPRPGRACARAMSKWRRAPRGT